MIELLMINKRKLLLSFGIISITIFIIIIVASFIDSGIDSIFNDLLIKTFGSLGIGLIFLVLIITLSFIHYRIEKWIFNKPASKELMKKHFNYDYLGTKNKWTIGTKCLQGYYNNYPSSIVYNLNNDSKINVLMHIDYPDIFGNNAISINAKKRRIYFNKYGIYTELKMNRSTLNNSNGFIMQLENLYQFSRNENLSPSTKKMELIK